MDCKKQKMVIDFKNRQISRQKLLSVISKNILAAPSYYGNNDDDIRHEFYAYIAGNIEKILKNYKPVEKVKFDTWFNLALKRKFFSFINKVNNEKIREEMFTYSGNNDIDLIASVDSEYSDKSEKVEDMLNTQVKVLDSLKPHLTEHEIKILCFKFGLDEAITEHETIKEMVARKRNTRIKLEQRITHAYTKIIRYQNKIYRTEDFEAKNRFSDKLNKVINTKRNLENKLKKVQLFPTNRWVAGKLSINEGTVAAHLNRIKQKIKTKIPSIHTLFSA